MKKKNFKVKKFDGSEKTHEVKCDDLITQYKRMSSIAYDIYNSDFFAMSTKKEQKEIEASVACITRTLVSMIGLDAIDRSYFPDDSGNGTGTDKDSHDAIKKMVNSVYGATGNMQKAAQKYTDTDHAPSSIVAMNRKILGELGTKSPADKPDEDPSFSPLLRSIALGNEYDDDSDEDVDDVDFGNFADGPFYSDQYKHICQIYGFNTDETLKCIVKTASDYTVSKINLVAVVNDKHDIQSDDKYYPNTGDVFFVTNKENDKDPVFVLIYTKSYLELFDFDIDKVSVEIEPVVLEESTKTNYIDFVGSGAYFSIGKVHLNPNSNQVIDLDATLEKIKDEARAHGIETITFVDTIGNSLDIYTKGKYTLEPGSLFCHRGNGWLNFMLIIKDKNTPDTVCFIWPVEKSEENASQDDIEFIGADAYYSISKVHSNSNDVIDLDATLSAIKANAKEFGIKSVTFVDTITDSLLAHFNGEYSMEAGSLFCVKDDDWTHFLLITKSGNLMSDIRVQYIYPVMTKKDDSEEDDIEFAGGDAYYKIDKTCPNSTIIDLDATLAKIKEMAKEKGIKTITFVDSIDTRSEIFNKNKYSLEIGSLFFVKKCINLMNFILVTETGDTPSDTRVQVIKSVVIKKDDPEGKSDSNKDGSHDVVDAEVEFEYTPMISSSLVSMIIITSINPIRILPSLILMLLWLRSKRGRERKISKPSRLQVPSKVFMRFSIKVRIFKLDLSTTSKMMGGRGSF